MICKHCGSETPPIVRASFGGRVVVQLTPYCCSCGVRFDVEDVPEPVIVDSDEGEAD